MRACDDMSETNRIQASLTMTLDAECPIDVRNERDCRVERCEQAARLAVRECRTLQMGQTEALTILMRLWREV